jgi:ubiquinone/menaquinone biosynthesis C-methylase UbiE
MEPRLGTQPQELAAASPVSPRWGVFVYQDAVLICPAIRALSELGVLEPSLEAERSVADLSPAVTPRGFGYMRVSLRCLASQGWLEGDLTLDPETTVMRWTEAGRLTAPYFDRYADVGRFLATFSSLVPAAWSLHWDDIQSAAFLELLDLACARWELGPELPTAERVLTTTHLDAGMVVPAMLSMRGARLLVEEGPALPDTEAGRGVGRFLQAVGWMDADGRWTPGGDQARKFAVHFGMAASYLPLLARLPELFQGEDVVAPEAGAPEWHVHRGLNVIASAAAHKRYFADADRIFAEIFDREPLADQPRFVADMGCGDGSWLVHVHRHVGERTVRGRHTDEHPLLMVGLDFNAAALEQARRVLDEAGIPALLLLGDISDPDGVSRTLAEHGLTMEDGLHIRAFIDHDRTFLGADESIAVEGWSSGAYVDRDGQPLGGYEVERDLVAHLERWAPHVRKHGIVMLEAHCVHPRIARQHLGATHSVAFDAYHGYSHQYPIEHSSFLRCCRQAGLQHATHAERRYPASRPFVAVSLNRLLAGTPEVPLPALDSSAARHDTWQPEDGADLEDGRGLHRLLYAGGDLRYPRLWASAATGYVVAGALEVVERRLADAQPGETVTLLDYGAGTGLAAIEFLKACRERGLEERLDRLGVTLELHLADLPSSWFAQGFELLRDCAWTRFHSLGAPGGGFRALAEVMQGRRADVVMANMVFHLIPHSALPRAAAGLAEVVAPGGRLLWNSPDLGPPGPYAVLFHDPNRALRARWLDLVAGERSARAAPPDADAIDPTHPAYLREAIHQARLAQNEESIRAAQARADRRVLPWANPAEDVASAVDAAFDGECEWEMQTHEILAGDIVDTLLVPSNQAEFLSEITDRDLREQVVRGLMLDEVLPTFRAQPAGTAVGLNVQWTLGTCRAGA